MRMTVRQVSDLVTGGVVGECEYSDPAPADISGALRLILDNCSDFMMREGIPINQGTIELMRLTFKYPGMAGGIEVIIGGEDERLTGVPSP